MGVNEAEGGEMDEGASAASRVGEESSRGADLESAKSARRHLLNHPLAYQVGVGVLGALPRAFNRTLARVLADLNFLWLRKRRHCVAANLAPILGDSPRELRKATRRLFRNYAEVLIDYATYFGPRRGSLDAVFQGGHAHRHIESALGRGRGVLLVTGHLGFWELGGLYFRDRGLRVHVLTVYDPDPGVHEARVRIRERFGIKTITVGRDPWSGLAVARALRENGIVGIAVERYRGAGAIPVDLFGRTIPFAPGPAIYARLTGAPVVPAFVVASGHGVYRGIVHPEIEMPCSADREADVVEGTKRIASVVADVIRAHPDQWYNFDPLWRHS
jgi:KDO2-lipid IV(A) lauroyltransferase